MVNRNNKLKKICISAVLIAVGTLLSIFKFEGIWLYGGGVTFCSMLPLVILSFRYGTRWGLFTSFTYSILQLILGIDNIQYATGIGMAVLIILLDYILPYTSIGLSSVLEGRIKSRPFCITLGIVLTFSLRFVFHFFSGWIIWDSLWPNELGLLSPVYSFLYNGSYMLPEAVITVAASNIIYKMQPGLFFCSEEKT